MKTAMRMSRKSGQAMTEYIIIVAVVALAAITIFALFSDEIQKKLSGAVAELSGEAPSVTIDSKAYLQDLDEDGAGN